MVRIDWGSSYCSELERRQLLVVQGINRVVLLTRLVDIIIYTLDIPKDSVHGHSFWQYS